MTRSTLVVAFAGLAVGACADLLGYDDMEFRAAGGTTAAGGTYGSDGSVASVGSAASRSIGGAGPDAGGSVGAQVGTGGTDAQAGAGGTGGAGGVGSAGSGGGTGGSDAGDSLEAERQACVDKVNQLRATVGVQPLTRWTGKESCVDGQVQADLPNNPHGSWGKCGETGQNGAWGGAPLLDFVVGVTQSMFDAGPGEVHHDQMVDPAFKKMACGFSWSADTNWALYQDFFE